MEYGGNTVCGVVRAVHGAQAEVAVEEGGCGRCHEQGGCGGQHLSRLFASGPRTYRVDNACGAAVGERVTIAVAAGHVRRAANLAYGVPLLAALAGAVAGNAFSGDAGGIAGALLAFAGALLYVRFRSRGLAGDAAGGPHIISRS